jgi:hypothetical protein
MSKHTSSFCNGLTVVSGIFLLMYAAVENVTASLIGHVSELPLTEEVLHSAYTPVSTAEGIGLEIVLGALLVILGLFIHAFFKLRNSPDIGDSKPRIVQVMWMEIWKQ